MLMLPSLPQPDIFIASYISRGLKDRKFKKWEDEQDIQSRKGVQGRPSKSLATV